MRFISIGLALALGWVGHTERQATGRLPREKREICTQDLALKLKSPELLSVFPGRHRKEERMTKTYLRGLATAT